MVVVQGEVLVLSSPVNREDELAPPPMLGSSAKRETLERCTEFARGEFSGEEPNSDMMGGGGRRLGAVFAGDEMS